MKALRKGSSGGAVTRWQLFLRGKDLYQQVCHDVFDTATYEATKAYQTSRGLIPVDGVVGNETYSKAMSEGFAVVKDESFDKTGSRWPRKPTGLRKMGIQERDLLLGKLEYEIAPTRDCPEAIRVTNSWVEANIIEVDVPQLMSIKGVHYRGRLYGAGPKDGKVLCHKLFAPALCEMFERWERNHYLEEIHTFDGLLALRCIRGSRTTLSNHAYGSAIDINALWNGLSCIPALVGQEGCVRELVEDANASGVWWLGHTINDGMHFELAYEAAAGSMRKDYCSQMKET